MLEIRNLTKKFGGLTAVHDVSVTFETGHINAIIGPNGAGKTTFFNLIAGTHAPTSGQIVIGRALTRESSDSVGAKYRAATDAAMAKLTEEHRQPAQDLLQKEMEAQMAARRGGRPPA